jgi:glycosyltransferase involved in cell wall biosynthesis
MSLVPALLLARWRGVGTVLWGHGYSKDERPWRRWLRRTVASLATALLFYNQTEATRFGMMERRRGRLFVAPNCLDQTAIMAATAAWQDDPERLRSFRQAHGLTAGSTILFVSRLAPGTRLSILLRAAAELRQAFPALRMIIIGDGPERSAAEELVAATDLRDTVQFLGAIYDEEALAPWFLSADVFTYPGNIGLSILHAFGYGVPVVTSDRIAAQGPEIEALEPGTNGLLFPDGDAGALASMLEELLRDEPRRRRMGKGALRTVREEFNIERMVDGMERAIRFAADHQVSSTRRGTVHPESDR